MIRADDRRSPSGSGRGGCRIVRCGSALAVVLLLAGCVDPVSDRLFRPTAFGAATPAWTGTTPTLVRVPSDGGRLQLSGWYWPPSRPDGDVLVYLPGRDGNRNSWAERAQAFASDGRGLLIASYRGYGDNPGRPDEQGLYEDGRAFVDWARRLQPKARLFLFGDALGAAVALHVAAETPVDAVVTLGAFDRFARFAPRLTRPFYADAFDNVAAIGRVRVPVLIMHGRKDEVVPFEAAERLQGAAGGKAVIVPIAGEAYHSFDLRYIAPVVWQALAHLAEGTPAG